MKNCFGKFTSFANEFPPFLEKSGQTLTQMHSSISIEKDIHVFLEQNKTGKTPPPEISYEPYNPTNDFAGSSSPPPASSGSSVSSPINVTSSKSSSKSSSTPAAADDSSRSPKVCSLVVVVSCVFRCGCVVVSGVFPVYVACVRWARNTCAGAAILPHSQRT
jgi:hypothetical protein